MNETRQYALFVHYPSILIKLPIGDAVIFPRFDNEVSVEMLRKNVDYNYLAESEFRGQKCLMKLI